MYIQNSSYDNHKPIILKEYKKLKKKHGSYFYEEKSPKNTGFLFTENQQQKFHIFKRNIVFFLFTLNKWKLGYFVLTLSFIQMFYSG